MAFALAVYKAYKIEKKRKKLLREKGNSVLEESGLKPKIRLSDKCAHCCIDCKLKTKKCCGRIFSLPKNSWFRRFISKAKRNGTFENYLLKSFFGFIAGLVLTYFFFMFLVFTLNFKLSSATTFCSILGCILSVGLAFNQKIRCIVCLVLPQFFSKRGRQTLMVYAFILALSGPGKNTLKNISILSESMACGQEQMKTMVRHIIQVVKKPFMAIKEILKEVIVFIKEIVQKIKQIFRTIKRIIMSIVNIIKAAFSFLKKIFSICSKKIGTPFERCTKVFDNAVTDCYAKLGPMFNWLCSIAYLVKHVCYLVKMLDFICMLLDYLDDSIIGRIMKKVRSFVRHIKTIFYVKLQFSHKFEYEVSHSKSFQEIAESIIAEVKQKISSFLEIFDFFASSTSLFFFIMIINALLYRYKYLTKDRFDNRYVTKDFREIDMRRAQMGRETILPLNHRERGKYAEVSSVRLVDSEKKKLTKSVTLMFVVSFKLSLYILIDYCIYWLMEKIRLYGRYTESVQPIKDIRIQVQGKGFLADIYKSVIKAFQPKDLKLEMDTIPCLPDPIPPNYNKYIQICFILVLCWIFAIFEPYGLRLRQRFMGYYYPTRGKERSIWLYNQILRSRDTFLMFARRKLRRKFLGKNNQSKVTCKEFIKAKLNNTCFKSLVKDGKQETCLLCGEVFRRDDRQKPIRCASPNCPGIYCNTCFNDLDNKCTICMDPIDYGDLSDVDEERDSSEYEDIYTMVETHSEDTVGHSDFSSRKASYKRLPQDEETVHERGGADSYHSDYSSDESSNSDYCQYGNLTEFNQEQKHPFIDLERQHVPDYVSLDIFKKKLIKCTLDSNSMHSDDDWNDSDVSTEELSQSVETSLVQENRPSSTFRSLFLKPKLYEPLNQHCSEEEDAIPLMTFRTKCESSSSTDVSIPSYQNHSGSSKEHLYSIAYMEVDEISENVFSRSSNNSDISNVRLRKRFLL